VDSPERTALRHIGAEILKRAARIGAPRTLLPSLGRCTTDAHPGLLTDGQRYTLLRRERGVEVERFETEDEHELLYRIFCDVTLLMAIQDASGAAPWPRQAALLEALDPAWRARRAAERA